MINKKWGLLLIPILILVAYLVIAAEEPPIVTLTSPADQTWSTTGNVTFNCSAALGNTSYQINEVELIIYRANTEIFRLADTTNGTTGVTANRTFDVNVSILNESYMWNHTWICNATTNNITTVGSSNLTYSNISSNRTFGVDLTDPVITLVSPANASGDFTDTIDFIFNATDLNNITNCTLNLEGTDGTINNTLVNTIGNLTNQTITTTTTPDDDALYWNITCYDQSGRSGTSNIWYIDTYNNPEESTSSGGAHSYWFRTYVVDDEQFEEGYTKELAVKHRMKMRINNEYHELGVVELTDTLATLNISSETIQIELDINGEAKVDVVDDGYYDLYVNLLGIENNEANITIQKIHEVVLEGEGNVLILGEEEETSNEEEPEQQEESTKKNYLWWIILGIILMGVISYFFLIKKKK